MEVTLTIENTKGELSRVSGTAAEYAAACEEARALIPEGFRAIAIRTNKETQ